MGEFAIAEVHWWKYDIWRSTDAIRALLLKGLKKGRKTVTRNQVEAIMRSESQYFNYYLPGTHYLYVLDHRLVSPYDKKPTHLSIECSKLANCVRREVANVLAYYGSDVIRLVQTPAACLYTPLSQPGKIDDTSFKGWGRIANHPSQLVKVRVADLMERKIKFDSEFVSPETVHTSAREGVYIIQAPYIPGLVPLDKVYKKLSTKKVIQIVIDAMRGNVAMHEVGWIHRDIKPDNVAIVQRKKGLLIDLECARKNEKTSHHYLHTKQYYEPTYYPENAGIIDEGVDVFAWGITLLHLLGEVTLEELVRPNVWGDPIPYDKRESYLMKLVDDCLRRNDNSCYANVIKSTLVKDRGKRVCLSRMIEQLKRY